MCLILFNLLFDFLFWSFSWKHPGLHLFTVIVPWVIILGLLFCFILAMPTRCSCSDQRPRERFEIVSLQSHSLDSSDVPDRNVEDVYSLWAPSGESVDRTAELSVTAALESSETRSLIGLRKVNICEVWNGPKTLIHSCCVWVYEARRCQPGDCSSRPVWIVWVFTPIHPKLMVWVQISFITVHLSKMTGSPSCDDFLDISWVVSGMLVWGFLDQVEDLLPTWLNGSWSQFVFLCLHFHFRLHKFSDDAWATCPNGPWLWS